jgi:ABC-2 type transport system ATP-binding protein
MIQARGLTKRFGDVRAVEDLTVDIHPGVVTGFLGPNGAGKSTTLRLILGLDRPTAGTVTVAGRRYRDLAAPMREVGVLLDARAVHGKRSARNHLLWVAQAGGLRASRVDEMLEMVGLADVAGRRIGGFSLGMSQRLGIAAALLGDPGTLLLDEPINGLDPEGIRWIRTLLRRLAAEGRTVVVSSHLMHEMEATADHVLVIARGRLIADASMEEFTRRSTGHHVHVVSPDAAALRALVERAGGRVSDGADGDGALAVDGLEPDRIGDLAAENGLRLHELTPWRSSLEAAFMELTQDNVDYRPLEAS